MIAEAFSNACLRAPMPWRAHKAMLAEPTAEGRRVFALAGGFPTHQFVEMRMNLDAYRISSEPFYQPVGDEIAVFEAAFAERLPVMLKGPTGCGKTRFVEHMAWRLASR